MATAASGLYDSLERRVKLTGIATRPRAGQSFDANGNMTAMPFVTMNYDIENRLASATHSLNGTDNYVYDPSNRRVWKQEAGQGEKVCFYGVDGTLMQAGTGSGAYDGVLSNINVYFAGKQVWRAYSNGMYAGGVVQDRLGSAGRYFPYGEEYTTTQEDRTKFATYYRDSTTTLDYANQRYYGSTFGRFTTPDPYGGSANPSDQQSWNRFAYVQNDPVNFNDPSGLMIWVGNTKSADPLMDPIVDLSGYQYYYFDIVLIRSLPPFSPVWPPGLHPLIPQRYVFQNPADADDVIRDTISDFSAALQDEAFKDCSNWLQKGLAGTDLGRQYGTLDAFLTDLPLVTGKAKISGTIGSTAVAMTTNHVPGKLIIFNTDQGFYKPTGSFVQGDQFAAFIKNIQANTPEGREFVLIHELGHLLSAAGVKNDAGSDANQKANNDLVWKNCGGLLMRKRE